MDIIDIMLARAMTPQGQTDIYVNKANAAAAKAEQAKEDAAAAVATVEAAAEEIAAAQESAADLLDAAQEALETVQQAQIDTVDIEDVDAEVKKLSVAIDTASNSTANIISLTTTYPDNSNIAYNVIKLYKDIGNNEDGTMTQKAITAALNNKVSTTTLNNYATIQYVTNAINNGSNSGSSSGSNTNINLDSSNAGHIIIVDGNGNIIAGEPTESDIIEALIRLGIYEPSDAVGLDINYSNKSTSRICDAIGLNMGSDFDSYLMYGGRKRCNVADDGTITAFYGDSNYRDDGSNGQVMVYQPKFYYQRLPLATENLQKGKIVRHETIILSAAPQHGFKLHPLFINTDGEELEYVLLSAYEGSVINNVLFSIAGQKPSAYMTIAQAEEYAIARGEGWHISNIASESAIQMLQLVEYGSLNGQSSLEKGLSNITTVMDTNCASLTGSTASLGNTTGHADSTINEINGITTTYTTNGQRAISYRGMENPWGNAWRMIAGVTLYGDGRCSGGEPYICNDYNYAVANLGSNYTALGFNLPADDNNNWINAMGYGNANYDWVLMPIECGNTANSQLPIGDAVWTKENLLENQVMVIGGSCGFQESNGMFSYGGDRNLAQSAMHNYNARLMFIPTKNSIYNENILKWAAKVGGN